MTATLRMDSPLGTLLVEASASGLVRVSFLDDETCDDARVHERAAAGDAGDHAGRAVEELREYFLGRRRVFDVPLALEGTDFQKRVWAALTKVPFGETRSYADLARSLGSETMTRAVGTANGANPIAIVVPCHRIVGADGRLTGYAGGLERKRWLLEHEGSRTARLFS